MNTRSAEILIGVDGGGTSCRFALSHAGMRVEHRGGSANVSSDFAATMATLTDGFDALAAKAGLTDLGSAHAYLGLAGVTGPDMADRVARALPFAHIRVEDDRRSALTGALGGGDGAVMGIGTGSFLARQHGTQASFIGGWGFILGDEASGAYQGRRLLQNVLHVMDGLAPATPLTEAVRAKFEAPSAGIVGFARDAAPAEFAAFAPMIVDAAQTGDATGRTLMQEGAAYILRGLTTMGWRPGEVLCPLGGLAPYYADFLPAEVSACLTPPKARALDGALALAAEVGR